MYSQTLERMAQTASSSECCTVNMVIGMLGVVRLISSNSLKPGVSGRSKWTQIMSACSRMGSTEFFARLQSQEPSNCATSSFVDRS
ncbi:hypothetical protein D3C76_1170970 [compost metagenome]